MSLLLVITHNGQVSSDPAQSAGYGYPARATGILRYATKKLDRLWQENALWPRNEILRYTQNDRFGGSFLLTEWRRGRYEILRMTGLGTVSYSLNSAAGAMKYSE
jgi:hypothetical protein